MIVYARYVGKPLFSEPGIHSKVSKSISLSKRMLFSKILSIAIIRYVAVSGNSLLLHDYLITFPCEVRSICSQFSHTHTSSWQVEYMWKAPWSAIKAGFLLNRYGNLVGQTVITLQQLGVFGPGSQQVRDGFRFTLFS